MNVDRALPFNSWFSSFSNRNKRDRVEFRFVDYRDQVVMTNKEENPTEKGGKYQILARPTEKVED